MLCFCPRPNLSGPALETVAAAQESKMGEDVGNVCQLLIFLWPGLGEPPLAQPAGIRDLSSGPTVGAHAEKAMASHSSALAWRIPGMGEPGRLPSMGSHRVGHD